MFSLKFSKKSIAEVEGDVRTKLTRIISDKGLLTDIGNTVIQDIKRETRRGRNGETGEKFKPLSKSWKKTRGEIESRAPEITHPAFSKNRSNLTLSGQLLDSLKIVLISKASVVINFVGTHTAYKIPYLKSFTRRRKKTKSTRGGIETVTTNRSGYRTIGKDLQNEELAEHVQETRPFMQIRPKLINQLKTLVIRFIRRNI